MSDEEAFRFSLPQAPQGTPLSVEEAEQILLTRLQTCAPTEVEESVWELVKFYSRTGRQEIALRYIERLWAGTQDPEKQAGFYLAAGQLMEQLRDFAAAASYYSQALVLEPSRTVTWYLINNNLGYCFNQLGKHAEAEAYCRSAIEIDPQRHNAYKNVGVALEGQGQWVEAARYYIRAVKANAADARALRLLEKLVADRPEISSDFPEGQAQLEQCRAAVQAVRDLRNRLNNPG